MVVPLRDKLSGEVEVDETLVGGKKAGKRGRGAEGKSLVVIAVEIKGKGTGRARLSLIEYASKECLKAFIRQNIKTGSTIITDGWKGYNGVDKLGYKHKIESKTVLSQGDELLPHLHRIAALLKRWLLGTHQNYVTVEQLEYYLDEFTFRYNRRTSKKRGLLFYRLMQQAIQADHISYHIIVKRSTSKV
jgi:transposase-like protein